MPDLQTALGKWLEASGIDPSQIGQGTKPQSAEVEGQSLYAGGVVCPWCWTLNDVVTDIARFRGYACWNCGGYFEI